MILVVGAKGMLGRDLMRVLPGDVRGVDIEEIDITSPESVRRVILTLKPRVVVNCAAYTDVDGCETNADLAMAVNGEGVGNLAAVTREIGALLVQMSTDYVFDGAKESPFLEDDPVNPLSVYGRSKLLGEEKARENPDHLIVRTQWLYGLAGKNFVETMLRLSKERSEIAVVDDQVGSPTWTMDLALAISELIENNCRGTYHAANRGICSWYEFARTIFAEAGTEMTVRPQTTAQLGRPAQRPLYSALCCDKLSRDTGLELEGWREALATYLETRREAGLS
ncbi:dTDP-4-dehydrorhamnose reductase [Geobacter sulfurreducens]|jgi:dTDP-4-dehydrorhamnose reductase|uniref:dTDP-4-dehydrorhamnose reductase n=1 Tax=Geobacter sulfurreducens TaxID=35554 RepID=UPI0020B64F97|nr:dTDP-4-dehydrorhamnose reductase [Geobacter sulfurreducens]UTG91717.1 dTDP-4-dehydrorhamnose reductase [Geobacter sulfurreducens]